MEATTLLDLGTILVLLLSSLVIILAGYINKNTTSPMNRSLQVAFTIIFLPTFLLINLLLPINQIRLAVGLIFITFIIPFSITFFAVWIFSNNSSMTRVQYISFISWMLSLFVAMSLRLLLGWSLPASAAGIITFGLISSVADGLLGGIIGNYLIKRSENYRPSR